jgi:hypothetical protein
VVGEDSTHLVLVDLDPKYVGQMARDARTAESWIPRLDRDDHVDEFGRGTWRSGPSTTGMGAKELAVLAPHQRAVDTEDRGGTEDDCRSHQTPRLQEQGAGPGKKPVPRGEVWSPTPGSADDEQLLTEEEILGHEPPDAAGSEDHHEAAD